MKRVIDLTDLYNKAFGVSMPEYKLYVEENEVSGIENARGNLTGKFGTPLYGSQMANGAFAFMPAYFDLDNDGTFSDKDYELPHPIIRIQSQKKIIETPLTERKGTVVEVVNQQSWKIYIKGFIIDLKGRFPEDEIIKLREVYERNEAISLRCVLTDLFLTDGDKVAIKNLNFPEVKGIEHVKPYEMELISVNVFDLTDLTPIV